LNHIELYGTQLGTWRWISRQTDRQTCILMNSNTSLLHCTGRARSHSTLTPNHCLWMLCQATMSAFSYGLCFFKPVFVRPWIPTTPSSRNRIARRVQPSPVVTVQFIEGVPGPAHCEFLRLVLSAAAYYAWVAPDKHTHTQEKECIDSAGATGKHASRV
jgi:hypothetical protein